MPDLDLWRQVFKQVDDRAASSLAYENVDCDGQSNALMNDNAPAGRTHLAYLARDRVMMVVGLKAVGGTAVYIHGTGTAQIDTQVPATVIVPAVAQGNPTFGFALAVALALHRRRLKLPEKRLLTGFSGIAGQAAAEFDRDPATGALGTVIHDNWSYRLSERKRLAGAVEAEPHQGYEVEGATILSVQQIGAKVHRLTCSAAPTAVKYAMQQRNRSTPENGQYWSAHRGEAATTLTAPSVLFPGQTLTRDVPGWRIAL